MLETFLAPETVDGYAKAAILVSIFAGALGVKELWQLFPWRKKAQQSESELAFSQLKFIVEDYRVQLARMTEDRDRQREQKHEAFNSLQRLTFERDDFEDRLVLAQKENERLRAQADALQSIVTRMTGGKDGNGGRA